jgi:hypothetical protein
MKMHESTKSALVKRKCIELLPLMVKYIPGHFSDTQLDQALKSIFNYIGKKDNKDRGYGFISLGKMSHLVAKVKFLKYLNDIFTLIEKEVA